jgi:hypothetical protein
MAFFVFSDTLLKPLQGFAALFGDRDLVVVYQQQLDGLHGMASLEDIEHEIPRSMAKYPAEPEVEHSEKVSGTTLSV